MALPGASRDERCPRCGTSISQHEVYSGEYKELDHPSLYVRFPLRTARASRSSSGRRRPGRCRRTLPRPCGQTPSTGGRLLVSGMRWSGSRRPSSWSDCGRRPRRLAVRRPVRPPPGGQEVEHRVVPWDEISLEEGTGIVHIAPGAGSEDFELGRLNGLPVLVPDHESGIFYDTYGHARRRRRRARRGAGRRKRSANRACSSRPDDRPPLSNVLALQDAAAFPRRRRLVHLRR